MNDKRATKIVNMLKTAAVPATLAAAVVLVSLVTANVCPSCVGNGANDSTEKHEVVEGELVANLTADNFNASVAEGVTLVDFYAPWCGPCKMQAPILEQVAQSVSDRAKVAKVNVDDVGSVAGQFAVQSIPTLVLFKDGLFYLYASRPPPSAKLRCKESLPIRLFSECEEHSGGGRRAYIGTQKHLDPVL